MGGPDPTSTSTRCNKVPRELTSATRPLTRELWKLWVTVPSLHGEDRSLRAQLDGATRPGRTCSTRLECSECSLRNKDAGPSLESAPTGRIIGAPQIGAAYIHNRQAWRETRIYG